MAMKETVLRIQNCYSWLYCEKPEVLSVKVGGSQIAELGELSTDELLKWIKKLDLKC
jgi:hypothetical protein